MNPIIEIWKDIPGYENRYQISSRGRIRSMPRQICNSINCRSLPEKIVNPYKNGNGYLFIYLYAEGSRKKFYIHRLVAFVFIPDGDPALEVNHRNKDRCNNCLSNLEWMTTKENAYHRDHYQETVDEPF